MCTPTGHRLHGVRLRRFDSERPSITARMPLLVFACLLVFVSAMAFPRGALAVPGLKVTNLSLLPVEGQLINGPVAKFTDPGTHTAGEFRAEIAWGDGVTQTATVTGAEEEFEISTAGHIYNEEGAVVLTVTVEETLGFGEASDSTKLLVADAPLSVPFSAPTEFIGAGASTNTALNVFTTSIGGVNNGTKLGEQQGGFRRINWDGVALDDSEPETVTIVPGHAVAIPVDSQQNRGVELDSPIAVANDGFTSVNPGVKELFGPLSLPNIAAPFNTNVFAIRVVAPSPSGLTPVPAATRAVGVTFLNVRIPNTTSVEYLNGETVLTKAFAPVGGHDEPSFVGAVFGTPVVTSVVITLGTARIFSFDGTNASPGPVSDNSPNSNLVAADDIVMAEPVPDGLTLNATAGVPLSGVLASFQDTDPNGNLHDSLATVDWGDGSTSQGVIEANGTGGFNVSGTHTYTQAGTRELTVTVRDLGGAQETLHATVTVAAVISPAPVPVATTPAGAGSPAKTGTTAPSCSLTAPTTLAGTGKGRGARGKRKGTKPSLHVGVRCDQDATVKVTATATIAGTGKKAGKATARRSVKATVRTLALGQASANVVAGHSATLTISLGVSILSKLVAASAQHRRITVRLVLAAANAQGKSTFTATVPALKLR